MEEKMESTFQQQNSITYLTVTEMSTNLSQFREIFADTLYILIKCFPALHTILNSEDDIQELEEGRSKLPMSKILRHRLYILIIL